MKEFLFNPLPHLKACSCLVFLQGYFSTASTHFVTDKIVTSSCCLSCKRQLSHESIIVKMRTCFSTELLSSSEGFQNTLSCENARLALYTRY